MTRAVQLIRMLCARLSSPSRQLLSAR